jgi:hypothetical protein
MGEEISPLEDHGWWMERLRKDAKAARPEALRLADLIQSRYGNDINDEAAAELRRLVAENTLLHERHHFDNGVLKELLEALKEIEPILARMYGPQAANLPPMQLVRAAIAKARGAKT